VCVEVGRDGRVRGSGHCCAPPPCAEERDALAALAALAADAARLAAWCEVGRESRQDR
jgi:hypothetical protein